MLNVREVEKIVRGRSGERLLVRSGMFSLMMVGIRGVQNKKHASTYI